MTRSNQKIKGIHSVFSAFNLNRSNFKLTELESGHINNSYRLETRSTPEEKLFLQKINSEIFSDVDLLMDNVSLVSSHLSTIHGDSGNFLELIPTIEEQTYFETNEGEYWRLFKFLEGYVNLDTILNPENANKAGQCLARFLNDFENALASNYRIIIPNFHNLKFRLSQLETSTKRDKKGRKKLVSKELAICQNLSEKLLQVQNLLDQGVIPTRISHNDTKASNIMVNQLTDQFCLIDYDTIMPGSLLFDFGDCMRSLISTTEENSIPSDHIDLNWDLARPYMDGFIEASSSIITKEEKKLLPLSCVLLPFLMGVRFLSDFLAGDTYFKVDHELENLYRAKNQLYLAREIMKYKEDFRL